MAINRRNFRACKVLIAAGADFTYAPSNWSSALDLAWEAILGGTEDPATSELLQNLFPGNDYLESCNFSKLHKIVLEILHCELKTELAKSDVDIDAVDSRGRSALSWAARRGDVKTVDALMKAQANLDLCDNLGKSPLLWALQGPNITCAELLLQHGANATILTSGGYGALYYAAWYHDNANIVKNLLAAGADVNALDSCEQSAMSTAAARGHPKSLDALLDGGAEINLLDAEGDSALMHTLLLCLNEATALLLRRGADYTKTNVFDESLLHYVIKGRADVETLDVLIATKLKGINPDAVDKNGKTALQLAQQSSFKTEDFVERFKTLLDGIRERNAAESNRANTPSIPRNGSLGPFIFRCLQTILTGIKKTPLPSPRTLWLYVFLSLGWIGFFYLLLRSSGTTASPGLQSVRPPEISDVALVTAEALPRESMPRSLEPSTDVVVTVPIKTPSQNVEGYAGQENAEREYKEMGTGRCPNGKQIVKVFESDSICPLVTPDDWE